MAKNKSFAPKPAQLRRLEALPQRFDLWQVGARQADVLVDVGGRPVRPWVVVVVSASEGLVLGFELAQKAPGPAQVWAALAKALTEPAAGEAHLPTQVQFAQEDWANALGPHLDELNVPCETVLDTEGLDEVLDEMSTSLTGPGQPGLLETEGVTPDIVSGFFDAAAVFYEQAPWRRVGERAIKVECPRFEGGPRYAVMMGQAGMTAGLVLYDDYETLERIREQALPSEESARITAALAVVFGTQDELPEADLEAAQEHGWRVAGPDAYPAVYRMDPGLAIRAPDAWELELLEGCLRAVPEFVRKKTRRLAVTPLTAPVSSGDLPLLLAWAED
jgi:hypothetical protein